MKNKEIIQAQSQLLRSLRQDLERSGHHEIMTPKLVHAPTDPKRTVDEHIQVNRESPNILAQSNQYYKQYCVLNGVERVYEISQYWRNNHEGNTYRHLIEFICLDVEQKGVTHEDELMDFLEKILKKAIQVMEKCNTTRNKNIIFPIPKISYDLAVETLQKAGNDIQWGTDLGHIHELELWKLLGDTHGDLFFITKYPSTVKKFYTQKYPDNAYTRTFDLDFCGWEICSGAVRRTSREDIEKELETFSVNTDHMQSYLELFNEETPSHGGFGFGINRFLALLLGYNHIVEATQDMWGDL